MHVLTENEIALKALDVIYDKPGINTTKLKLELEQLFILHPADKKILKNRSDSHFSQKVRNLVSHHETNFFGEHTIKGPKINNSFTWQLNQKGLDLVSKMNINEIDELIQDERDSYFINQEEVYPEEKLVDSENRVPKKKRTNKKLLYIKDYRITKTYLKEKNYICEYNRNHKSFCSSSTLKNYVEGHHLIPIKGQADFKTNIDRRENIVSLCPVCHKQIHLGTKEEKIKILKRIFKIKESLLHDININISYVDLYNKYYV